MKHFFLFISVIFLCSCGSMTVSIENQKDFERANETVEILWADVLKELPDATAENIIVKNSSGKQIPSQVTDQALIFQVTMAPKSTEKVTVTTGERESYKQQAFGRTLPEMNGDFAWENNRIAFRVYGPQNKVTSNGIDVWVKSTSELVIDKWAKAGTDISKDNGEGLDFFELGRTLGAGAMAPTNIDTLCLGGNFTKAEILDNGPIRVTVRLHYAPFEVNGVMVTEQRTISLDANSNFNRITELYTGDFDKLKAIAGVIMTPKSGAEKGKDSYEGTSQHFANGFTYSGPSTPNGKFLFALIMPEEGGVKITYDHLNVPVYVEKGKPYTYTTGAGWTKGGFSKTFSWEEEVEQEIRKLASPLIVTIN